MIPNVQVFAHRGAKAIAPENTLPAFGRAIEMGAAGIELDVQCSKDSVLVVIHDYELDKTTDGHGPVQEHTAAELARLDAGSHFHPSFAGTPVPTLDQALDLIGDRCRINIEIKSRDRNGGPEVDLVIQTLRARNLFDQVIVSSFNVASLIKLRWMESKAKLGLLYYEELPPYLRDAWLSPIIAPDALHPHHSLIDSDYMAWAKSLGLAVNTWTVNDVGRARELAALGVDVIMTDVPDAVIAALATP